MKKNKNKKYWKEEAKGWKEVARIESEEANKWAAKAIRLEEELEIANEKQTIKPGTYYNIPYPSFPAITTTGTSYKEMNINPKSCNCNCNCKK